jgi:anti-sigma factor RsiW
MTCSDLQDRLAALLAGEVPAEEMVLLRRHLAACPDCRREYALLSRAEEFLRTWSLPEPDEALTTRTFQLVLSEAAPAELAAEEVPARASVASGDDEMAAVESLLEAWQPPEPPRDLTARTLHRITAREPVSWWSRLTAFGPSWPTLRPALHYSLVPAALALLVAVVWWQATPPERSAPLFSISSEEQAVLAGLDRGRAPTSGELLRLAEGLDSSRHRYGLSQSDIRLLSEEISGLAERLGRVEPSRGGRVRDEFVVNL